MIWVKNPMNLNVIHRFFLGRKLLTVFSHDEVIAYHKLSISDHENELKSQQQA